MNNKTLPQNVSLDTEHQKEFSKKVQEIKKKGTPDTAGVVYVGHIPRGFFEPQMRQYFTQFGKVSKLRISRSKKTGKTKGYAFVEFASDAVAKIVADAMNNYLMFHRLLKCQYVPIHKVHPATFKGCDRQFKKPKAHILSKERHNSDKTTKQQLAALKKMKNRKNKSLSKLADMGIDFDFPGIVNIQGKEVMEIQEDVKELDNVKELNTITEEQHMLVVDEFESEILFTTPPHTVKSTSKSSTGKKNKPVAKKDSNVQKKIAFPAAKKSPKERRKSARIVAKMNINIKEKSPKQMTKATRKRK